MDNSNFGLAELNPFRYRSYYYDSETGFYYLQSRYYDPEIGRFVNADGQLNNDALGCNLFAYCGNNPTTRSDPTGKSFTLACIIVGAIIGAVVGGVIGAHVSKKKTGKVNGWTVAECAVVGGAVGGLIGWGIGAAVTAIGATATGAVGTAAAPVVEKAIEDSVEYNSWQSAEQALRYSMDSVSSTVERTFSTIYGNRIVDSYNAVSNIIAEAKYGYQGLSSFISTEIQRDAWLLQNGVVNKVEWHFYYSQVSNSIGPSNPLHRALLEAGIDVFFH